MTVKMANVFVTVLHNASMSLNDTVLEPSYSDHTRIMVLLFSTIIILLGVTGNILIIWTVSKVKQLRKKQNIFVVFLSVVDLLITGYLLPFNMYVMIYNDIIHSKLLCKMNALICHVLFTCSVQFIMYIALCRYTKICHSRNFDKTFSLKRIFLYPLSSIIIGLIFGLPLLANENFLIFDRTLHLCIFNRFGNRLYSLIYMGMCLVIPISVTAYCYLRIYFHVRKSKLKLYQHWTNPLGRRRLMYELNVTRSQFAVFVAYLVLYFPFGITAIFGARIEDFPDEFHALAMYLCFVNSCVNSLLYGALNRNMRKGYMESLPCISRDKVQANQINLSASDNQSIMTTNSQTQTENGIFKARSNLTVLSQVSVV